MSAKRLGFLGLAALCCARAAVAQPPAAPPSPSVEERLAAKAKEHRLAVSFRDGAFSGPGWDLLLEEGRKSRFFLVGEEHGIAEAPAVVRELFRALQPAGYRHLAIEISPPMAGVLDELARGPDGLGRLAAFFAENPPGVAFFTLREEAELLVATRAAVAGGEPVLWGLDYEVAGDRYLLGRMRQRAPEGPARTAVQTLYERSAAAWTTVKETKDPAAFFTFANPPEVLAGVRQAWPSPDPESALALDTLEETLAINQLFVTGSNWESNQRRALLNRRNFLRYWHEALGKGPAPRVLFKMGASHMLRGRNISEVFDLGNLVSEMAAADGAQSFHLLVVGGAGTQHAVFNPMEVRYEPAPVDAAGEEGLERLIALPEGFTVIDLRPLRPLLSFAETKHVNPELMRIVHGFDAILVLTGSHPSQTLP